MVMRAELDASADISDSESETQYQAECERMRLDAKAIREAPGYVRRPKDVLDDPGRAHIRWLEAATVSDFSNIDEETVVGALGYFVLAIVWTCQLRVKDQEMPQTREEWIGIMSNWLNHHAHEMAKQMGRNKHPELFDALQNPESALVSRIRHYISTRGFRRDADLRCSRLSEAEKQMDKLPPPVFATPRALELTEARLQSIGGSLYSVSPPSSPNNSPTTTAFSANSGSTTRTRNDSDAASASKPSPSGKPSRRLSTPAGGGVKTVSLPSTPETAIEEKAQGKEEVGVDASNVKENMDGSDGPST